MISIYKYTPEIQRASGSIVDAESWMHIAVNWQTQTYVIYIWDTRQTLGFGVMHGTNPGNWEIAIDNHQPVVKPSIDWLNDEMQILHNSRNVYGVIGASNHSHSDREPNDFYCTPRPITLKLLDKHIFDTAIPVLEPCCGTGNIAKALIDKGFDVKAFDIVQRGFGEQMNFFDFNETWNGNIITNPPYNKAQAFVKHALDIVTDNSKVAMFLKLTFLEGNSRKQLFAEYPPKVVMVCSSRVHCNMKGDDNDYIGGAIAYAWFIWQKGFQGPPIIQWI